METSVPLVNSSSFPRHAGHTVRVWGTLQRVSDDVALVKACDQGTIEVILAPSSALPALQTGQLVEVIAKVSPDGAAARELQSYALPAEKSLNMDQAQQLIELQYKFPTLFGAAA